MQSALAGLTQIRGVKGYSVFDARGTCVEHQMPPPYEPILINQAIGELRAAFDAVKCLDESGMDSFVGRFELGCIVLKPLSNHTVMLLTAPDVNMATLNIGLKVALLKLERVESGTLPSRDSVPHSGHNFGARANISSNMSLSPGSPINAAMIPADAVGPAVMSELTKLLAVHIGPMAKVIMKKELAQLGLHPQTVGAAQFNDLVSVLARKVPDPAGGHAFISAARNLASGSR